MTNSQRGMTLIEVMVALVILALVSLSVMRSSTEQLANLSVIEKKYLAGLVAENQLAMMALHHTWPHQSKGQEMLAGKTWFWQWNVQLTSDPDIRVVEVNIREAEHSSPLVTLRGWRMKEE